MEPITRGHHELATELLITTILTRTTISSVRTRTHIAARTTGKVAKAEQRADLTQKITRTSIRISHHEPLTTTLSTSERLDPIDDERIRGNHATDDISIRSQSDRTREHRITTRTVLRRRHRTMRKRTRTTRSYLDRETTLITRIERRRGTKSRLELTSELTHTIIRNTERDENHTKRTTRNTTYAIIQDEPRTTTSLIDRTLTRRRTHRRAKAFSTERHRIIARGRRRTRDRISHPNNNLKIRVERVIGKTRRMRIENIDTRTKTLDRAARKNAITRIREVDTNRIIATRKDKAAGLERGLNTNRQEPRRCKTRRSIDQRRYPNHTIMLENAKRTTLDHHLLARRSDTDEPIRILARNSRLLENRRMNTRTRIENATRQRSDRRGRKRRTLLGNELDRREPMPLINHAKHRSLTRIHRRRIRHEHARERLIEGETAVETDTPVAINRFLERTGMIDENEHEDRQDDTDDRSDDEQVERELHTARHTHLRAGSSQKGFHGSHVEWSLSFAGRYSSIT